MLSLVKNRLNRSDLIYVINRAAVGFIAWSVVFAARADEHPVPPLPHARPSLPGTHVHPESIAQKLGLVLHVDGPFIVEQKRCQKDSFEIKFTVTNYSTEPATGALVGIFNGMALSPIGSAKLSELQPGKAMSGAFRACCPANGLFAFRLEYWDEAERARKKGPERLSSTFNSANISCK